MPETAERWTAARVRALPEDGRRYEVVDGELLVTPAPSFDPQRAVGEMFAALREYLRRVPVGEVVTSPRTSSWTSRRWFSQTCSSSRARRAGGRVIGMTSAACWWR
jgi:Uma2 family endonuclease